MRHAVAIISVSLLLSACATVLEGTQQEIVVNSKPDGAECLLTRGGATIGFIKSTPGSAVIDKTKDDITIVCKKSGFAETRFINHSGTAPGTYGNIVAGGWVGWGVDSAAGADNKYDSFVFVKMNKKGAPAVVQHSEYTKGDIGLAVDNIKQKGERVAVVSRDNITKTASSLRKWLFMPLPEQYPTPVAASYCYRAFQDIVCYRRPMPGWEHRLIAYQGTDAETPPPAITRPLPVRDKLVADTPASRLATASPVFSTMPSEDEKEPVVMSTEPSVNNSSLNETLPNPALAPQL